MSERYLKQVIVVRNDLSMPRGKVAAMVAHAAMTFITSRLTHTLNVDNSEKSGFYFECSPDEQRWLTELDPGLEHLNQLSFAKIVVQVDSEQALLDVEARAKGANLTVHRCTDSGHSHNKPNTLVCVAIGPHWPEQLEAITGRLKIYR